jgi:signal transduction histidine kinase
MGEGGKKRLRVLVVEDNEDDAYLLVRELERGPYAVEWLRVEDVGALRAALAERPWDLVVSDWSLPTFTGLVAFQIVSETGLDLPFIIVSGTVSEEVAVEALRAGAHDFMFKGRYARLVPAIERELREADERSRRALAEQELEQQRAETQRSERLLRSVLQTIPEGVLVVDADGEIVMWSAGATDVLRSPRPAVKVPELAAALGLYLTDCATPMPAESLVLTRALAGLETDRQEVYLRRADVPGGVWLLFSGRPFRASDGTITGALAVVREVTQERGAHEQLMISDRMASVGMLAAGVAHEINNPLGAALLNLETMQELVGRPTSARGDAELKESLSDARAAVARVREIVGDLRIFSRHEERSSSHADVIQALESSLRMADNEIRHRAHVVRQYGATPPVSGSEARLGQVFLNLMINAAQSIPEGNTLDHAIHVTTETDANGAVVIEISDTGSGIRAEDVPHLFTPFFTTKPPGIGTGLGLPICHRIVSQLGGTITVESEVGRGSTFRVTIPAARGDAPSRIPPAPSSLPGPISARRGRVLVVDDEPMLASAIRRVLSREHDVETTTRAEDALDRLRAGGTFDVIFSDLMMPQVTGMELYARICKEFPEQAPRVVFLTGGAFTQAAHDFLLRVANPTLEKPIDRLGLLALVRERVKSAPVD